MKKDNEQNAIVLVFGRKYSGKTTLLKKMIQSTRRTKSVLIIDKITKFTRESDKTFKTGLEFYHYIKSENKPFCVSLNTTDDYEIKIAIVAAYMKGNISIFMDEADSIFNNSMSDEIKDVVLRGRNQGIDLILTGLRPHKIGVDVRNQADYIYSFQIVNKKNMKTLVDEFGHPEILDIMRELDTEKHEYLKYQISDSSIIVFSKGNKEQINKTA